VSDLANRLVKAADAKLEELYLADGAVSHATAARWVAAAVLRELAESVEINGVRVDPVRQADFLRLAEVIEKGEQT
jgi:hypothetical protein